MQLWSSKALLKTADVWRIGSWRVLIFHLASFLSWPVPLTLVYSYPSLLLLTSLYEPHLKIFLFVPLVLPPIPSLPTSSFPLLFIHSISQASNHSCALEDLLPSVHYSCSCHVTGCWRDLPGAVCDQDRHSHWGGCRGSWPASWRHYCSSADSISQ